MSKTYSPDECAAGQHRALTTRPRRASVEIVEKDKTTGKLSEKAVAAHIEAINRLADRIQADQSKLEEYRRALRSHLQALEKETEAVNAANQATLKAVSSRIHVCLADDRCVALVGAEMADDLVPEPAAVAMTPRAEPVAAKKATKKGAKKTAKKAAKKTAKKTAR